MLDGGELVDVQQQPRQVADEEDLQMNRLVAAYEIKSGMKDDYVYMGEGGRGSCIVQRYHSCFSTISPEFDSLRSRKFLMMFLEIDGAGLRKWTEA